MNAVSKIINSLGLEKLMFEAADPEVFSWYIKNYGPEVNLFIDHSQIIQLEILRRGIWGSRSSIRPTPTETGAARRCYGTRSRA